MSEWNPRLLAAVSWVFPLATALAGFYALSLAATDPFSILVAAVLLVVASFVGVATSDSGNRFTTGIAVAAAIPFVFSASESADSAEVAAQVIVGGVDLSAVVAAYCIGLATIWTIRFARGEDHVDMLPVLIRRVLGYGTYAAVYAAMRVGPFATLSGGWEDLAPFAVALLAWLTVEVIVRALLVFGPRELSRGYLARALLQDLNVFVGLALTGALFGELYRPLGWWALPIALLPYSFAHAAFKRFQQTKTTYKQTIRALARIPEVSGLGVDGHADRTTALATAIAKEMGLGPATVEQVEFAALMHDIGRVSLNEPQVLKMGFTDDDIARWSSEIIAESPYLERVADHVRHQYQAYRQPGQQDDPDISDVSRIIKVAAAFDWRVHRDRMSPLEALESLHTGAAYDFDPEVVASLRRILQTRRQLSPTRA
jgi:hypothetical protein